MIILGVYEEATQHHIVVLVIAAVGAVLVLAALFVSWRRGWT
jgi:hypothetical protein